MLSIQCLPLEIMSMHQLQQMGTHLDCINPCEPFANVLVAMEISEEDLDGFLNCWHGKQYTYLI